MRKKIIIGVLFIMSVVLVIIGWRYKKHKENLYDQPFSFDLLVAESFYEKNEDSPWRGFWDDAWNEVSEEKKRPVDWLLSTEDFEKLDSVYVGFKNISNEKFFYVTWGAPNSRVRINYKIFRDGKVDSIPFGGFGCGTGIHLAPVKKGENIGAFFLNPLMFNPFSNYHLPLKHKKFPELFKEIYGDSVSIKFEQATYSLPWNKVPSQMIESPEIVISSEKVIDNWEKGEFISNQKFEELNENGFLIKDKGKHKVSSFYTQN